MQFFAKTKNFSAVGTALLLTIGAALFSACTPAANISNAAVSNTNSATNMTKNANVANGNTVVSSSKSGYHFGSKFTIGGDAGWDYVAIDSDARRVYVTHFMNVEVLDADSGAVVGKITDTPGVHGVALVTKDGKAYTSNGKADTVSVVDLKTLKHTSEIKTGKKPDAIVYNPNDDKVYVSNGDGDSLSVIDVKTDKVVGTIPVGGAPECSTIKAISGRISKTKTPS